MYRHGLEKINLNNPIEGKIPMITEYFVKFYGEQYRDIITNRIKNTSFIFVNPAVDTNFSAQLKEYFDNKKSELISSYLNEIKIDLDKKQFDKLSYSEMLHYLKKFDIGFPIPENSFKPYMTSLLKLDKNFSDEALKEILADKKARLKIERKLQNNYSIFKRKYKAKFDYLDSEYLIISEKYIKNSNNFTQNHENNRLELIKSHVLSNFAIDRNSPDFDLIANEYNELLKNNTPTEKFVEVLNKYTDKKFSSLDNLLADEKYFSIFYDVKLLAKLGGLTENHLAEITENNPTYVQLMQEIEKNNLSPVNLLKNLRTFLFVPNHTIAYVDYTYRLDKPNEKYNICVLPSIFSLDLETLIHEINHVVQCAVLKNSDYEVIFKTGLYISHFDKKSKFTIGSENYYLLNEVINDYTALKISKQMEQDGIHLGLHEYRKPYYTNAFPLLSEYLEEELPKLKKCLLSTNPKVFNKMIDTKELNEMATLIATTLRLTDKPDLFEEIEEKIGKNANLYDHLDYEHLNWSEDALKLLDCYKDTKIITRKVQESNKRNKVESKSKSSFSSLLNIIKDEDENLL